MNMTHTPGARDSAAGATLATPVAGDRRGWEAQLSLRFTHAAQRTVLAGRSHRGPLVVQKPLYPEGPGICHAIVLHPPGGIAGGDRLHLTVELSGEAHALLTTPGAGKWYKANGRPASQHLHFAAADAALLEWLPQETIVFDAADCALHTRIELAPGARYAGWEILCLGRRASGERFHTGRLRQRQQIWRDGRALWGEYADLRGGDALLQSPVGLNGCTVSATFLVAAGAVPAEVLAACRAQTPADGSAGTTALPEIFAARYLGDNAESARHYFERLWAQLRPWYAGAAAQRPRIWNT